MANEIDVVKRVKAELVASQAPLGGPCGAFEITQHVAWELSKSGDGAGLLDKPTGNNCRGRAVDIICYPDGSHYDILLDGGGENGPTWRFAGMVDPSRYRAPFDPAVPLPVPVLPPEPLPGYPGDEVGVMIGAILLADVTEAGQTLNAGSGVWFWRTAWDIANEGLSVEDSISKHQREWRAVLGLPV